MKALIQHNFNSGLGDCIVAVNEYINNAYRLKQIGFSLHLSIITKYNKYYEDLNLFDLLEYKNFEIFDTINYSTNTVSSLDDMYIKHISYGASQPGMHWWDLFLDNNIEYSVITFPQNGYSFNGLENKKSSIEFSSLVYDAIPKSIQNKKFQAIYARSQDCQEYMTLNQNIMNSIQTIYQNNDYIFVCSNSFYFKNLLKSLYPQQTLSISVPMEESLGCHIYKNKEIEHIISKERTILSMAEMFLLSKANSIFFITEWGRVSNFLFPAISNHVPVVLL